MSPPPPFANGLEYSFFLTFFKVDIEKKCKQWFGFGVGEAEVGCGRYGHTGLVSRGLSVLDLPCRFECIHWQSFSQQAVWQASRIIELSFPQAANDFSHSISQGTFMVCGRL